MRQTMTLPRALDECRREFAAEVAELRGALDRAAVWQAETLGELRRLGIRLDDLERERVTS